MKMKLEIVVSWMIRKIEMQDVPKMLQISVRPHLGQECSLMKNEIKFYRIAFFILILLFVFVRVRVVDYANNDKWDEMELAMKFESRPSLFEKMIAETPELLNEKNVSFEANDAPTLAKWARLASKDAYFNQHVRIMIKYGANVNQAVLWLKNAGLDNVAIQLELLSSEIESSLRDEPKDIGVLDIRSVP